MSNTAPNDSTKLKLLDKACMRGDEKRVAELLQEGVSACYLDENSFADGASLISAVRGGNAKCLSSLLEAIRKEYPDKIPLPVSEKIGVTLLLAADGNNAEAVHLLIPECRYASVIDAMNRAISYEHDDIIEKHFWPVARNQERLEIASYFGWKDEVVKSIKEGARPSVHESKAVRNASRRGHTHLMDILYPTSKPKRGGEHPVRLAAMRGHDECLRKLLGFGIEEVHIKDALRDATSGRRHTTMRILIDEASKFPNKEIPSLKHAANNFDEIAVEMLLPICSLKGAIRELGKQTKSVKDGEASIRFLLSVCERRDLVAKHLDGAGHRQNLQAL